MKRKLTQAHGRWTSNKETKQKKKKSHKKRSVSASPLFLLNTIFITEESQNHIQHKQTGRNTGLLIYHRMLILPHKNQNWRSNLKNRTIYHETEIPRPTPTKFNPQRRDFPPPPPESAFPPSRLCRNIWWFRSPAASARRGQGSAGGRPGARRGAGLGPPEPGALHRAARSARGGPCLKTNPKQPRPNPQPPKKRRGHAGTQTSAGLARPPVPRGTKQPPAPARCPQSPTRRASPGSSRPSAAGLAAPRSELARALPGSPGQRRPLTVLPL